MPVQAGRSLTDFRLPLSSEQNGQAPGEPVRRSPLGLHSLHLTCPAKLALFSGRATDQPQDGNASCPGR